MRIDKSFKSLLILGLKNQSSKSNLQNTRKFDKTHKEEELYNTKQSLSNSTALTHITLKTMIIVMVFVRFIPLKH